jgi:hypothetical protein
VTGPAGLKRKECFCPRFISHFGLRALELLHSEALALFFTEAYKGGYEVKLLEELTARLPETPPGRV